MRPRSDPAPNEAASVDAPVVSAFHIVHRWRRTTDQRRSAINLMSHTAAMILILTSLLVGVSCRLEAAGLESLRTNLEQQVGGSWQVLTNASKPYLSTSAPRGAYCAFLGEANCSAICQATNWMNLSQAPFFVLGTNSECAVITYALRNDKVSRTIVKALRLDEPRDISAAERFMSRARDREKNKAEQAEAPNERQ